MTDWPRASRWLVVVAMGSNGAIAPVPSQTVRDSAGIRIVESSVPVWGHTAQWRVDTIPVLSIRVEALGSAAAAAFSSVIVWDVTELPDGNLGIAVGSPPRPRCYSAAQAPVEITGLDELGFVRTIAPFRGDSLLAFDIRGRMLLVLDARCRVVRRSQLFIDGNTELVGVTADGTAFLQQSRIHRGQTPPVVTRHPVLLYRQRPDGTPPSLMGSFPGEEWYEGEGFGVRALPFARSTLFAVAADGFLAGTNDAYEVRRFGPDGELASIMRRQVEPKVVQPERHAALRSEMIGSRKAERASRFRGMPDTLLQRIVASEEAMFAQMPFPATYPSYSQLLVDREGYLWMREYQPTLSQAPIGRDWAVYDPDGRWLGTVTLPAFFTLHFASGQHVLGVQRDETGSEYIRSFRILGR